MEQMKQINEIVSKLSTESWKLSMDTEGHLIANIDGLAYKAPFRYDPFNGKGYTDISSFISRSVLAILRRYCSTTSDSIRILTKTIAKEAVEIERLAATDEFNKEIDEVLQLLAEGEGSLE